MFSHYKSMGVTDPQGSLDPRGLIGRINGDVATYHTCIYMVSKKIFSIFSHKSTGAIDPQREASFDPRSLIGMIYLGYH